VASGEVEVDRLLADLARWMGEERTTEAVRSRSRERWLRQQAIEEATFAGIVLDLAERGQPVIVRTTAGRTHHGHVVAVATDFVVIAGPGHRVTLLALDAVALVRPAGAHDPARQRPEPMGDRAAAVPVTFTAALAGLAGDRPHIQLAVAGATEPLVGELRAVGDDVLTLRQATNPPQDAYVRLASVTECSLLGSG
jgi:hypothetical protein